MYTRGEHEFFVIVTKKKQIAHVNSFVVYLLCIYPSKRFKQTLYNNVMSKDNYSISNYI